MKKFCVFIFGVVLAVNSFGSPQKNKIERVSIPIRAQVRIVEANKVDENIKIFDNKVLLKDKKINVLAVNKEKVSKKNGVIKINNSNKRIVEMDVKI